MAMSSGQQIVRNAAWLIVATTFNKLFAFVSFAIVASMVGPKIIGSFFYSVSITSIVVILADLGMTPVVIRAIAGAREESGRLLGATVRIKALLVPIAVLCAIGYGVAKGDPPNILATIAIASLVMTADTFHLALYGALRGKQNLKPEAMGMLIGQIFTTIVSIAVAYLAFGSIGLAVGLLAGSLWNVCWALFKSRQFNIRFPAPTRTDYRILLHEAAPFAMAGIAVKLYSYADSLLIEAYHGTIAVGMYAVAYKMTYALQFLPLTFTAALYPALATSWAKQDHESLRHHVLGSMRFLAGIAFPLSAGLSALAPRLIPLIYGEPFVGAVGAFQILPWVLIPIFLDFPVGSLLNATHRAHLKTIAMVGTMFINILCNALLVPQYGPIGAAWAGVISFWMLLFFGLFFIRKDLGHWAAPLSILFRAVISAAVSWSAWALIGQRLPLFAAIIFGGALAACMAFGTKLVTKNDVLWILSLRKRPALPETASIHADD